MAVLPLLFKPLHTFMLFISRFNVQFMQRNKKKRVENNDFASSLCYNNNNNFKKGNIEAV